MTRVPNRFLTWLAALILIGTYAAAMSWNAQRFPPPNSDEIVILVNGWNDVHGSGIRYSLNDDIYPQSIYGLRDLSNQVSRPLFVGCVGALERLLGRGILEGRSSAWLAGCLSLMILSAIGYRLGGAALALLLPLLAIFHPVFIAASTVINETMFLMLAGCLLVWLSLDGLSANGWMNFLGGLAAALPIAVHQYAIALWIGASVLLFRLSMGPNRFKRLLAFWAGIGAGCILLMKFVDLKRMILFQKVIYWNFARPPILEWPWRPWLWLRDATTALFSGGTFYFSLKDGPAFGWTASIICFGAAAVLSGLIAAMPARSTENAPFPREWRAFLEAILAAFLAMAMMVRRQEAFYNLVFLPFAIPWMGLSWRVMVSRGRSAGLVTPLLLLAASMGAFISFEHRYIAGGESYAAMMTEIDAKLPAGAGRILGPNTLWPHYPVDSFRDVGATVTARYFSEGNTLRSLLENWKPDILITEASFRRAWRVTVEGTPALTQQLGFPVDFLGTVDTGNANGVLSLYRLHWPSKVPPAS